MSQNWTQNLHQKSKFLISIKWSLNTLERFQNILECFVSFQSMFLTIFESYIKFREKTFLSQNMLETTLFAASCSSGRRIPRKNVIWSQVWEFFSKNWFVIWPIPFRGRIYMYVRDFLHERLAILFLFLSKSILKFWLSSTA